MGQSQRGLATVSVDGPGQGEGGFVQALRPDYEVAVGALLDELEQLDGLGLDLGRVGITGLGLGGYFAARAAAFEPRIKAVGAVGGPYQFPRMPPAVQEKFMHAAQLDDREAARGYAVRFTLEGVVGRVEQPYLVVHGQQDAVMPWQEAQQLAQAAPRGEFLRYSDGGTGCHSVSHKFSR